MYHYRDKNKVEVDIVLQDRRGVVVGIEGKVPSTVRSDDFRGLAHLGRQLGDEFCAGVVVCTGAQTPFGDKLRAMPISALWQLAPD